MRYVFTVSLDVGSLQLNILRKSRKYSSQLKDTRSERSPRALALQLKGMVRMRVNQRHFVGTAIIF